MGMELIERIRERAYQLWEAEGCAHGRDMEYWFRAEADVSAGTSEMNANAPSRSTTLGKSVAVDDGIDAKPATAKTSRSKKL